MNTFTDKQVMTALEDSLRERGADYVYSKSPDGACAYSRDGEPSCLVGLVVHKLDPEAFREMSHREHNGIGVWMAPADEVLPQFLEISEKMLAILYRVQTDQDTQLPYRRVAERHGVEVF